MNRDESMEHAREVMRLIMFGTPIDQGRWSAMPPNQYALAADKAHRESEEAARRAEADRRKAEAARRKESRGAVDAMAADALRKMMAHAEPDSSVLDVDGDLPSACSCWDEEGPQHTELAAKEWAVWVREAVQSLPPVDRAVVRLRFGLDCEALTYEAIGSRFGWGRERTRQILERALATIRRASWP